MALCINYRIIHPLQTFETSPLPAIYGIYFVLKLTDMKCVFIYCM